MPTDRTYPAADGVDTWYASKSTAVTTASDVVVGTQLGIYVGLPVGSFTSSVAIVGEFEGMVDGTSELSTKEEDELFSRMEYLDLIDIIKQNNTNL